MWVSYMQSPQRIRTVTDMSLTMAKKASATVKVDENGRLYLPSQTRKALGIYEEEAQLDLDIELLEIVG